MKHLVILIAIVFSARSYAQLQNFTVGQTAPDFSVTDKDGTTQTLYQYTNAGKYVIIDFFAYWCGPCMGVAPTIDQFYKKYGCNGYDVAVLGIEADGTNAQLASFDTQANLPADAYPAASGLNGNGAAVEATYNPAAFPTIVLIGPDKKFISIDIWPIDNVGNIEAKFPIGAITQHSCLPAGIEEANLANKISVYPNPANGDINLKVSGDLMDTKYEISNQLGQTVLQGIITGETVTINMATVPDGVYFLRVNHNAGRGVKLCKN